MTQWKGVLVEKLTVAQLVKTFPAFMDHEGPLLSSQESATGPCFEPVQSTTLTTYLLKICFNSMQPSTPRSTSSRLILKLILILYSHLYLRLPHVLFYLYSST